MKVIICRYDETGLISTSEVPQVLPTAEEQGYVLDVFKLPLSTLPMTYYVDTSCFPLEFGKNMKPQVTTDVVNAINAAATTWNNAASTFGPTIGKTIFTAGGPKTIPGTSNTQIPDGINLVEFGPTFGGAALTYAYVWAPTNELIEFDIILDPARARWGTVGTKGKRRVMDIQSAVTHEFGHVCGLKDVSGISNTEQTIYGATATGETKKRTLESGDIAGLGMKLLGY
jgi:hypothetical protein